jgi:hypothetical protein
MPALPSMQGCDVANWGESHDEWTLEESARGRDGAGLSRFLWHARLGPTGKELLLQLPLPGCRFARLPDELRRLPLHVLLRLQHEVLHVYRLLPLQSAKLLQEVGMLQQHLLPAEQLVLLHLQLLHVRSLRSLLLHLRRHCPGLTLAA